MYCTSTDVCACSNLIQSPICPLASGPPHMLHCYNCADHQSAHDYFVQPFCTSTSGPQISCTRRWIAEAAALPAQRSLLASRFKTSLRFELTLSLPCHVMCCLHGIAMSSRQKVQILVVASALHM